MLNIAKNVSLLRNKSKLFRRYNLSQVILHIRNKQNTASPKDQCITEADNDDRYRPIKFSQSSAARMRTNEYRYPYHDTPTYQSDIVSISIAIFLIYFCILREENDIDMMLSRDLSYHFEPQKKQ